MNEDGNSEEYQLTSRSRTQNNNYQLSNQSKADPIDALDIVQEKNPRLEDEFNIP